MTMKIQNMGIFQALVSQLDKLARHNRQGSFRTKDRYYQAMKRFCTYLADEYHLQKLTNISGKHLTSYVLWMQENGKAASTIKTDLAAIRFFHDKMSNPKYRLPDNDELAVELERRCFGGTDRTWSNVEFNKMLGRAMALTVGTIFLLCIWLAMPVCASTSASVSTRPLRNRRCGRMPSPSRARAARSAPSLSTTRSPLPCVSS